MATSLSFPAFAAPVPPAPSVAASPVTIVEDEVEPNFDLRCTAKTGDAKAAIKPASVLLGYQAGASYLAVTLSADALTLNRVAGTRTTTLATVKQFYKAPAAQGTPLVIQWREGNLRVIYDSRTVLRQEKLGALKGGVGTAAQKGNLEFADALFQPVEPVHFSDDFMRSATVPGLWQVATGNWKLNTAGDTKLGANPFSYIAQGKSAIAITGDWFWNDYTVSASVRPSGDGAVGLVTNWQDDKNYLLCKWYAEDSPGRRLSKKQLWRVVRGQATLIGAAPGGYHRQQWYRLSMSAADGVVKIMIDGQTVMEKSTDIFGQGKIGLFADEDVASAGANVADAQAMFDDVQVLPINEIAPPEVDQAASGPARFASDQSMEDWASPKGQWLPADSAPGTLWNRGMFFGNYAVEVKATGMNAAGASASALLGGDGTTAQSGYALQVKPSADGKTASVALMRAGKQVSTPTVTALKDATACLLKLQRNGNALQGLVDNTQVVAFNDPKPLAGRRAGYASEVAQVAVTDAHIIGGNMLDYTFYNAPTDWQVGSGTWDVASRWICTPTWTWYAGWSDRAAAVWNKHSFSGDFAVEVFAACKMDSAAPPYYLHPRDLNITVSGDGVNPASGYSCIYGGWNNTFTRILRGTKTVAETDKILLPMPYHGAAHHKWFCLRVEKTGDTISYYIDRKLALQYKDPKPLEGKRIALWTSGNGIMVARATVYYEKDNGADLATALLPVADELPIASAEKLNWQVRGADPAVALSALAPVKHGERPAIRAVNVGGGGNFAIAPQIEPFDALKNPKLTFQCRMDKGAQINLYLRIKGIYHAVRLSGPDADGDAADAKSIGAFPVATDGKWHDVSIDLATLLKPLYPTDTQLMVDEVFLGDLARDPYLQAGFGANYPGTSYTVRYFALRSDDNRLAKLVEPQLQAPSRTIASLPAGIAKSPQVH